jgi:2-iminobutanoate/2-iminopropanoate deaminase
MLRYITLPGDRLRPVGPFCHAVRAGELLFLTGQLAQDPATGAIGRGPLAEQTRQVMDNLGTVLAHAGAGFDRVVSARIFLTDFRDFDAVNAVYASYFPEGRRPCRTTVGVLGLAGQGDVEIDLIAWCGAE